MCNIGPRLRKSLTRKFYFIEYVSTTRVSKRGETPLQIIFPLSFLPPKERGIKGVR
jgi:hypothetical protein